MLGSRSKGQGYNSCVTYSSVSHHAFTASAIRALRSGVTAKSTTDNGVTVLEKKLSALKKLMNLPSDSNHQEEFERQMSAQINDRGYCLLLASTLENLLDEAIVHRLPQMTGDLHDRLFELEGPAGSFSRKITLAQAIGMLGPVTYRNFTLIRHIRNAFAHAKIPITFATKEVADVSNALTLLDPFFPERPPPVELHESPRDHFHSVIAAMTVLLTVYAGYKMKSNEGVEFSTSHGDAKPLP